MKRAALRNWWFVLAAAGAACSPESGGGNGRPDTGNPGDGGPDILPCHILTDRDGDTIADQYEGDHDRDGDTLPNWSDDDSDGDGILDAIEGGTGGDVCRYPRDTDGDTVPDAYDTDSDNDGLSDQEEVTRWFTDPLHADSDRDGVTDLGEVAYGSDPNDGGSSVAPGDFFVILPYLDPPQNRDLRFGTDLQVADVYFLMDSTGSMDESIENVVSSLSRVIVPAVDAAIPDVQMGSGAFNDFNCCGGGFNAYGDCGRGTGCDQPYWHDQDITDDVGAVQRAIQGALARGRGYGGDWPESYVEALYLTATGEGLSIGGASIPAKWCEDIPDEPGVRRGYPCFRSGALPIVVTIGDAAWHNGPGGYGPYSFGGHTYDQAREALLGIGARMIGVCARCSGGGGDVAWQHQAQMARDTGTVDASGNPLVAISGDGAVSSNIVTMIETLVSFTPQDVDTIAEDDPTDAFGIDATGFITAIRPAGAFPADGVAGWDERVFFSVQPGTSVIFNVTFENTIFPPRDTASVFKATIVVRGNYVTRLDSRQVIIIVPPGGGWVWIG
ncbi:MAG: hypothetical protein QME96_02935 [Myxococcota bacterium]|nr:hypothetical protein [Myxococcota bacterium]